jgi:hypothetical protein
MWWFYKFFLEKRFSAIVHPQWRGARNSDWRPSNTQTRRADLTGIAAIGGIGSLSDERSISSGCMLWDAGGLSGSSIC